MRSNTLTWIVLILLSVVSYLLGGRDAALFVLLAAGIKAGLVGWQFMELRTAHPVWNVGLLSILAVVLGLVALLA